MEINKSFAKDDSIQSLLAALKYNNESGRSIVTGAISPMALKKSKDGKSYNITLDTIGTIGTILGSSPFSVGANTNVSIKMTEKSIKQSCSQFVSPEFKMKGINPLGNIKLQDMVVLLNKMNIVLKESNMPLIDFHVAKIEENGSFVEELEIEKMNVAKMCDMMTHILPKIISDKDNFTEDEIVNIGAFTVFTGSFNDAINKKKQDRAKWGTAFSVFSFGLGIGISVLLMQVTVFGPYGFLIGFTITLGMKLFALPIVVGNINQSVRVGKASSVLDKNHNILDSIVQRGHNQNKADFAAKTKENEELQKTVEDVKKNVNSKNDELKKHQDELVKLKASNDNLDNEKNAFKSELDFLKKENVELKKQQEDFKQQENKVIEEKKKNLQKKINNTFKPFFEKEKGEIQKRLNSGFTGLLNAKVVLDAFETKSDTEKSEILGNCLKCITEIDENLAKTIEALSDKDGKTNAVKEINRELLSDDFVKMITDNLDNSFNCELRKTLNDLERKLNSLNVQ
ncbi:MAG: hypothetical protein RL208_339, partial [Pseudomonadota bacterium]